MVTHLPYVVITMIHCFRSRIHFINYNPPQKNIMKRIYYNYNTEIVCIDRNYMKE